MEKKLQFLAESCEINKVKDSRFVVTSLVRTINTNKIKLNKKYDFGYIQIEARSSDYQKLAIESARILNDSQVVLSSYHFRKGGRHFFMTEKGKAKAIVSNNDNLDIVPLNVPFQKPFGFVTMPLLGSALPAQMNSEAVESRQAFYNDEKYYRIVRAEEQDIGNDKTVNVLVCIEAKIAPDWSMTKDDKPLGSVLKAVTVTFTSLADVENFKPYNLESRQHKERMLNGQHFNVDDEGFVVPVEKDKRKLKKNAAGLYVRGTITDKPNRTSAYLIDHDSIKLDEKKKKVIGADPKNTRAAHAYKFLDDLADIYEGAVEIEFQETEFQHCYNGDDLMKKGNKEYKAIMQVLSSFYVRIINKTEKPILDEHIRLLEQHSVHSNGNIKYLLNDERKEDDVPELILLVTEGEEYYARREDTQDPYPIYKSENPDKVIQSVEYRTLFRVLNLDDEQVPVLVGLKHNKNTGAITGGCPTLECILAQLQLKLEVHQKRLFIDRKTGVLPEDFVFVYPYRIDGRNEDESAQEMPDDEVEEPVKDKDKQKYSTPFEGYRYCAAATGDDGITLSFFELSEEQLKTIQKTLDGNHVPLAFGKEKKDGRGRIKYTHERHPFMFNFKTNRYMFFVRTDANAMPNHRELEEYRQSLIDGRGETVSRVWFQEYITREGIAENVVDAVTGMLEEFDVDGFYHHQVRDYFKTFKPKGGKRKELNKNEKSDILHAIHDENDIRWYSGVRTKEMKHMVVHQDGFLFSESERCYYAGKTGSFNSKNPQEGFCKIYRIIGNCDLIEGMDKWFLTMSVRNRQTTVYPFIIQHAKEYASMTRSYNISSLKDSEALDTEPTKGQPIGEFEDEDCYF